MSKPIKNLIAKRYEKTLGDVDSAVLVDIRGIPSNDTNRMRAALKERGIRVMIVKNALAKKALEGTALQPISVLLEGPSAFVYGGESVVNVARELLSQAKELPNLDFKGAVMEGQVFQADQIEALSKYPTREEAIRKVAQLVLSPGRNLGGALLGAPGRIASLVKAIQEKLEEKGEAIEAAG